MKTAMWTLEELQRNENKVEIDGRWVPLRPLNYRLCWCPIWKRIWYAWQVVTGRHETFEWPEGQ